MMITAALQQRGFVSFCTSKKRNEGDWDGERKRHCTTGVLYPVVAIEVGFSLPHVVHRVQVRLLGFSSCGYSCDLLGM